MFNIDITAENWLDPAELAVSIWLLASPFALGFFDIQSASLVMIGVGTAVFLISQLGLANHLPWEEMVNTLLALLLLSSPWLFGYTASAAATINALASGVVLITLSIAALIVDYNYQADLELAQKAHASNVKRGVTGQ